MSALLPVLRRLFLHRFGLVTLGLLLLQQLIVASSSFWLVRVFSEQAGSPAFTLALVLYMLSLFLPHLPGTAMFIYLERWHQESLRRFLSFAVEHIGSGPLAWGDAEQRQKRTALISAEGQRVIADFVKYAYEVSACGLNALCNLLVVGLIIEPMLLLSYGVGLVGSTGLLRWFSSRNAQLANEAQAARMALSAQLLRVWDNVVLGNLHNRQVWQGRVDARMATSEARSVQSQKFSELIGLGVAFFTLVPSILVVLASVVWSKADAAYAMSLVAILPRLFQILNTSHHLLSHVSDWNVHRGKLQSILELVSTGQGRAEVTQREVLGRVRFSELLVGGEDGSHPVHSLEELVSRVPHGRRLTLTGSNGSGKSTLLLLLKERLGAQAVYLPPQNTLDFEVGTDNLSTGQRLVASLNELLTDPRARVLLLDEWDANLDWANEKTVSEQLDRCLERGLSIVEVRHRRPVVLQAAQGS
ncbi:hypothetical protein [Archangium violaceum]|uniref:hypothetical protein n=1 Tax=Archangium violaceum TaxID=83451 RepID=UPI0036DE242D